MKWLITRLLIAEETSINLNTLRKWSVGQMILERLNLCIFFLSWSEMCTLNWLTILFEKGISL